MEDRFQQKLQQLLIGKNANNIFLSGERYSNLVQHINRLKSSVEKKKPPDYRLLKKYDVISVGGVDKLVLPVVEGSIVVI